MRRFTFLFFLTLLSSLMWTSVNAQQYCAAAGSDTQVENITNVTFAGINNTTTTHLGYNDFTGLVAQVAQGEQQQLSVTINAFIGGGDFVYAFIDWNGNGILNDVGEVYTLATNTFSSWSYTLNVTAPNDAVSGNIRMRIIIAYDKINPDPCGNFDYGEVEDYTISITPPLAACPTGDFTFYSQAEIDAFGTTYGHCTEIPGNVLIQGGDITNLDGLSALESIGWNLIIRNNSQLTNLDGLSNLTEIGGNLIIRNNSQLTNLDGLSNLTEIGGDLDIYNNSQLTNLDGLSALESINGYLVIYNNAVLTDISGLQNIDPATILPTYDLGLYIENNPLLSVCNLDNFCTYLAGSGPRTISGNAGDCVSVTAVTTACTTSQEPQCPTGDVALYSQTDVNNFATNYPNCTEITGNLQISGSNITDLSPLNNIQSVGGYLNIESNSQLTNLDELSNLTQIGGFLAFQSNDILENLDGLGNLTQIGGYLNIYYNSQLTNLDGLGNLTQIGGNLYITSNSQLTNLDGLSALESINGSLFIYDNPVLTDISGLQNIDPATILSTNGLGLYIQYNPLLSVCNLDNFCTYLAGSGPRTISGNAGDCVSVTAVTTACTTSQEPQCPTGDVILTSQTQVNDFGTNYPNCTEITGNLYIGGSDITDLSPLSNIQSIGGYLNIQSNSQLTNLDGLSALESINGDLVIYNNPVLTDISGLQNIDPATILPTYSSGLYIQNNPLLSVCNLDNFCTYLAGSGPRTISGNAGDCVSVTAVTTACTTSQEPQCPTGDVALYSQTDVNNFATNYPNCTEITGYLYISGSDITDLSPLSNIQSVGGYLQINNNSQLTNLDGLSNLTQIGGYLYFQANSLTNLDGLSNLTQIGGDLNIQSNSQLTNLDGLSALESIGDGLYIESNVALTDISGLANINPDTIGGDLYIVDNPLLSVCNLSNFCAYLAGDGERTISGNLGTCYDVDAVVAACNASVYDCPDLELNIGDTCTDADGNEGTVDEDCNCYVEPTPAVCEWTVHIWDNHWGDDVTWSLTDQEGNVLLQGGYYDLIYDDTQTVTTEGPLTFTISNVGEHNDNIPNYTVSNGTEILVEGQLTQPSMTLEFIDLNCSEVTPPIYDCPDLEANFGDVCTDADGNEGTVDEDCNCYVEPTPPVCEWTVHIWDDSFGDYVTWSLKDKDGNVLLQGGDYDQGYDDTQTVTTEGPLKFAISNEGYYGDNRPNYTVSNGTEILVEGQLTESPMTLEFTDLNCYVAPTCSAEWTGAVSEDWNTAANWCDNTVPTAGSNVVINNSNLAIIDINTVVTIESITLGAAANVTVNGLLNVGDITVAAGGSLVIANDANLLQSETATNTGNITVKRNTVIKHLDYTIWSSPVADQELEAFSPNTLASRIYQYNTSTDAWEVTAENFTAGKGIMFRAPNLFDDGNYPNAYTYEGVFTGTPHNGDISVSFSQVGEYQGVGNPYPSNIKITGADGFWNTNPTVGTLYFWTNTNAWDTGTGDYVANNWATYSNLGGLAAANSTKVPVDIISVGQGFVIKTPGLSSISFNNGMRIAQNSVFFRTIEEDKHRLWLNLSDSSSELNNILIGYMDGATQGEDLRIDSKMFNYNGSALYSLIESNGFAYTIQGRSLPFDDFDVVPLGFRAITPGSFTVSLASFDGLFAQGQDIFLKDNLTQTQHNLKDSDYTFVSNQGEFTTRFEVVYRTSMNVTNPELSNAWTVYAKNKTFFIETQGIDLKEVMVYDMLGRVIYESQAQGNKHSFAQIGANQVLVIKVITTDNKVLTKKVSN